MMETNKKLSPRITSNPEIFKGQPIVRGLLFKVSDVLEMMANGMTKELILAEHPVLMADDIEACLLYAAMSL